jgi:hypothetical protein
MSYNKNINFNIANNTVTRLLQSYFNHSCAFLSVPPHGGKPLRQGGLTRSNSGLVNGTHTALINTPVYLVTQGGKVITVQLSYYLTPNTQAFYNSTLPQDSTLINALTQVYESVLGQPVTVQLELVRLHQPYMDASILAQYLAINLSKQGFSRITNLLLNAVPYLNPAYAFNLTPAANLSITGVKVQLSGLLTSQRNRSRKTTYTATAGTFSRTSNVGNNEITSLAAPGTITDYGNYTSKSGLGAFTVKV